MATKNDTFNESSVTTLPLDGASTSVWKKTSRHRSKKTVHESYPIRALIRKNLTLQWQQRGTNICQIITPVICLYIIFILKTIAENQSTEPVEVRDVMPRLMNQNLQIFPRVIRNIDRYEYFTMEADGPNREEDMQYLGTLDEFGGSTGMFAEYDALLAMVGQERAQVVTWNVSTPEYPKQSFITPYIVPKGKGEVLPDLLDDLDYLSDQNPRNITGTPSGNRLADGSFLFHEANPNSIQFRTLVNNYRRGSYHRWNGFTYVPLPVENQSNPYRLFLLITEGMMSLIHFALSSFAMKEDRGLLLGSVQKFPYITNVAAQLVNVINIAGASLFPLALSLLLPVFMYGIVLEKEGRLVEIMKMNGLRMRFYWLVQTGFCLGLYMVALFIFLLFGGAIIALPFFTQTNFGILLLVTIGWGLSQVALAFFFSVFISKARTATVLGYLISIVGILVSVAVNTQVYPTPEYVLPTFFYIDPQMGLARAFYVLSSACAFNKVCVTSWPEGVVSTELTRSALSLYLGAVGYFILALYLHQVWPQEFGVRKSPLFFISEIRNLFSKKQKRRSSDARTIGLDDDPNTLVTIRSSSGTASSSSSFVGDDSSIDSNTPLNDDKRKPADLELMVVADTVSLHVDDPIAFPGEDTDVIEERKRVSFAFQDLRRTCPLVCKDLRKVYPKVGGRPEKVAVNSFSLAVARGEVFGLLGPNGAGKTSLISILTGLYEPDGGDGWVAGYSIKDSMDNVQLNIGVCPQFDILWPELTVKQHLLFFARLKGVPHHKEQEHVKETVAEVGLEAAVNKKAAQLSGGMKRRLSVAISLIGDPKIIFMDEPTTGLDPQTRRLLWDTLSQLKRGRSMVLTTHSMEEADVLCSRIGIVAGGVLRCVGSQLHLKNKYGSGYHLHLNFDPENAERIQQYMAETVPTAELVTEFPAIQTYAIPVRDFKVSNLFEQMESDKDRLGIVDWGISQTSLEDVFLRIVEEAENGNTGRRRSVSGDQRPAVPLTPSSSMVAPAP
eukprot:GILJ01013471.1.p1 GENE.GILJ01013471.1~~GILJ01013471.1.p1  ORF type:complete len:1008 (+),score=146.02 GILJ01013471.1:44-3067(+)